MKRIRRVWGILQTTGADKMLLGFLLFLLADAFVLKLVEPQFITYGDALWYAFSVVTTVGFGDYAAVTTLGRLCTVLLGVYGLLVVALIPGVLVSYYLEFTQRKADETTALFLEKLEHLEELPPEELRHISKLVREKRYRT